MSSEIFEVSKADPRLLRNCLGNFATGVTIVTCNDAKGQPRGVTANSFSSVSLEPALILWSIGKSSSSLAAYLGAEFFAVNILSQQQNALSSHFARSADDLFVQTDYQTSAEGVPLFPHALAHLECRQYAIHEAGDHHIIVGEVLRFSTSQAQPLVFFQGQYAELANSKA